MGNKGVKLKDKNGNKLYPCPFYPVGSIYLNVTNVNPANYFGGTWEQIKDTFLLACGSIYVNGSTGGNAEHSHSLSANAGASIRKYDSKLIQGRYSNAGKMPAQESDKSYWITDANSDYSSSTLPYNPNMAGIGLYGNTDNTNILPPYLAVYVWKRTA